MFFNYYMLAATMPLFMQEELHGSTQQVSLVISLFIFGSVLLRPFSGIWADQYGRKKMAWIAMLLFLICSLSYLVIDAIIPLLLIRIVHGMSFALGTTSIAAIAISLIPADKKGQGIGYFSLFMSLAMVFGPAMGLFLVNRMGYMPMFIICIGATAISLTLTLMLKSNGVTAESEHGTAANAPTKKSRFDFIETKAIAICLSAAVLAFSYSAVLSFITVYTKEIGLAEAALYFFTSFAIMIILPRPWVGKLFDAKGPNYLIYPGLLLFMVGLFVLSIAHTALAIILAGVLMGTGFGALFPSFQTLSVKHSTPNRVGAATATFFLLFDVGYGIGAYLLSLATVPLGFRGMFALAGAIVGLSMAIYYWFYHRINR